VCVPRVAKRTGNPVLLTSSIGRVRDAAPGGARKSLELVRSALHWSAWLLAKFSLLLRTFARGFPEPVRSTRVQRDHRPGGQKQIKVWHGKSSAFSRRLPQPSPPSRLGARFRSRLSILHPVL
jgi:hypothetical protein